MTETVASHTTQPPVISDLAQHSQQSSLFVQPCSSLPCLEVSAPTTLPRSVITPSARKTTLQPPCGIANDDEGADGENYHQQQGGNHDNHNAHSRQQKKVSRFLLEVPQLNRPQRSTTNHSMVTTAVVTPNRPQPPSISIPRVSVQQPASTLRKVTPETQVPTLVTPSRPKLHTLTQPNAVSTPSRDLSTPLSATLKSSIQIRKPAQIELTRPAAPTLNKPAAQPQPLSDMLQPTNELFRPPPPPPIPTENMTIDELAAPQKDGATDSNVCVASIPQPSLETQVMEKNASFENSPQQTIPEESARNIRVVLEHNRMVTQMDTGEGSSVDAVSEMMQIQKSLPTTTPTQTAVATTTTTATDMTSMSTAENVEMGDPSSLIPAQQAAVFNHVPQEMNANGRDQAGAFSFYEGEMYQQPNRPPELVCY